MTVTLWPDVVAIVTRPGGWIFPLAAAVLFVLGVFWVIDRLLDRASAALEAFDDEWAPEDLPPPDVPYIPRTRRTALIERSTRGIHLRLVYRQERN